MRQRRKGRARCRLSSPNLRGDFDGMTIPLSCSHEEATIERFQRDPHLASEYLATVLENGDEVELLQTSQRIAKAFGGIASGTLSQQEGRRRLTLEALADVDAGNVIDQDLVEKWIERLRTTPDPPR